MHTARILFESRDEETSLSQSISMPTEIITALSVSSSGDVYFAERGRTYLSKIDPMGIRTMVRHERYSRLMGNGPFYSSIISVGEDRLYAFDSSVGRLFRFGPGGSDHSSPKIVSMEKGVESIHFGIPSYSNGYCMDLSPSGELYISDPVEGKVYKIDSDSNVYCVAGDGTRFMSQDNTQATEQSVNTPSGLAVGFDGRIYIADPDYHRVRVVDNDGIITTLAGTGAKGYNGDHIQASGAMLNTPKGLAIDSDGNVYIADFGNHRIRKVSTDGIITTIAGTGQEQFLEKNGSPFDIPLPFPSCVSVDPRGGLCVLGGGRTIYRIRQWRCDLRRYERDRISGTDFTACTCVMKQVSPLLYENLLSKPSVLSCLDECQSKILTLLIDSLLYNQSLDSRVFDDYHPIELLSVFMSAPSTLIAPLISRALKRLCILYDTKSKGRLFLVSVETLEKLERYKSSFPHDLFISISKLYLFHARCGMKDHSVVDQGHIDLILSFSVDSSIVTLPEAAISFHDYEYEPPLYSLVSLFDNERDSDFLIHIGEKSVYCHKTILASSSSYFNSFFNLDQKFKESNSSEYVVDSGLFPFDLHEMAIRMCYGIDNSIEEELIFPMMDICTFYGMDEAIRYLSSLIDIQDSNYLHLVSKYYQNNEHSLSRRLLDYAMINRGRLFSDSSLLSLLPGYFKDDLIVLAMKKL